MEQALRGSGHGLKLLEFKATLSHRVWIWGDCV